MNILLVEDDPVIGESIRMNFELEGFHVLWAKGIEEATALFHGHRPDYMILDLSLPDGYGMNFCKKLRGDGFELPILVLSAESSEESVVKAFEIGANDYVRKPFSNRELLARVRSHEGFGKKQKTLQFHGLSVDPNRRLVSFAGKDITLNRREFDILQLLVENTDSILRREVILEKLAGGEEILDRTIDSHISHLRTKLKQAGIDNIKVRTEYGIGYRLIADG